MSLYRDRCTKFFLLIDGVETEISEPIKWDSVSISLKRDTKFYGVNYEFSEGDVPLQFDCDAGRDLIDGLYDTFGNDAEAYLLFDEDNNGVRTSLFTAKLDFNSYEKMQFVSALSVKRVYFNDLLRSRFDLKTSLSQMLSVDGNATYSGDFKDIELHSKTIRKNSLLSQSDVDYLDLSQQVLRFEIGGGTGSTTRSGDFYIIWGYDTVDRQDLNTIYSLLLGQSPSLDAWIYEADEAGLHDIDLLIKGRAGVALTETRSQPPNLLACGQDGGWNELVVETILGWTDSEGNFLADITIRLDTWTDTQPACHDIGLFTYEYNENYTGQLNMSVGDRLYLYTKVTVSGDYNRPVVGPRYLGYDARGRLEKESYFSITANTSVPVSKSNLMLSYEMLNKLAGNITGVNGCVDSDFFGRTDIADRSYASNGCGALTAYGNGLAIRGFDIDEKPTFKSLSEIINDLQAIYNIGFQLSKESRLKSHFVYSRKPAVILDGVIYDAPVSNLKNYTVNASIVQTVDVPATSFDVKVYKDNVLHATATIAFPILTASINVFSANSIRVEIANTANGAGIDSSNFNIVEYYEAVNEDVIKIEHFDYFFQDVEVLQIDSFENYSEEVATDFIFNSANVGYSRWENEEVNGLDEFATKQQVSLPIRTRKSEKTANSDTIASGYALEFTRRLRVSTEDSSYDNDMFIVQLRLNGAFFETEKDEPFDSISGILDPSTAYNLRLSPKRNLMNWASYINAGLYYKSPSELIKFISAEGNYELSTQFDVSEACLSGDVNRIVLSEKGDIELSDFNAKQSPLRPEIIKFRANISFDDLLAIKSQPYGYITLTNAPYGIIQGYLLSLRYNPNLDAGYTDFELIKKA